MKPELKRVDSSSVFKVGYDASSRELWIVFKSAPNIAYVYKNVPKVEYDNLMDAVSIGMYVSTEIVTSYESRKTSV